MMEHIVYLDYKSKELEHLLNGTKDIILRAATGRKVPYGRVQVNDLLYFCLNNGEQRLRAKAVVTSTLFTEKLTQEESEKLIDKYLSRIQLMGSALKRFRGKRYVSLIFLQQIEEIESIPFQKSDYPTMDDWITLDEQNNYRYL